MYSTYTDTNIIISKKQNKIGDEFSQCQIRSLVLSYVFVA